MAYHQVPEGVFTETEIAFTPSLKPAEFCIEYWNRQRGGVRLARLIRTSPDSEICSAQLGISLFGHKSTWHACLACLALTELAVTILSHCQSAVDVGVDQSTLPQLSPDTSEETRSSDQSKCFMKLPHSFSARRSRERLRWWWQSCEPHSPTDAATQAKIRDSLSCTSTSLNVGRVTQFSVSDSDDR